jgi:pyruvate/2-oxoglutarate dehydrogenase complex dihydrolipoamide acyltransferase (E2) component
MSFILQPHDRRAARRASRQRFSGWRRIMVFLQNVSLGVAVALDWGLIVPVIKNADEKSPG